MRSPPRGLCAQSPAGPGGWGTGWRVQDGVCLNTPIRRGCSGSAKQLLATATSLPRTAQPADASGRGRREAAAGAVGPLLALLLPCSGAARLGSVPQALRELSSSPEDKPSARVPWLRDGAALPLSEQRQDNLVTEEGERFPFPAIPSTPASFL